MEDTDAMSIGVGNQSLFGRNPSAESETKCSNIGEPQVSFESAHGGSQMPSGQVDSLMEENEHDGNEDSCSTPSTFSLFAPSIQMLWREDLKKMSRHPRWASLPPEAAGFDLYSIWRNTYNISHDANGRPYQKPADDEFRRDTVPFDLLKDIINKLTNDAPTAMELARRNVFIDPSIPQNIKERAPTPTIYDLPLSRRDVVKQSLFNSVPYPGLTPPERWGRWLTNFEKAQAPTIETSGLDTFIRIARALAALGMPTYICDPIPPRELHSAAIEAAIWTDLGRQPVHDWTIKQTILKASNKNLTNYLATPGQNITSVYWDIAFSEHLWAIAEFQLLTHKMVQEKEEGIWMPKSQPNQQSMIPTASVERVKLEAPWIQLDCWKNPQLRRHDGTFHECLRSLYSIDHGAQYLCNFPNFIRIRCGGGKGRTRQQMQPSFIITAIADLGGEEGHDYRKLSCLYKAKIVWRVSSELGDNELRDQTRKDDFQLYDSDKYQELLRRAQDPEQLPEGDEGDDGNWTLETSPIDYCFVVIYYRVGREMNEEGFQKEWESDPGVKRMYPERGTMVQGKETSMGDLPDRSR